MTPILNIETKENSPEKLAAVAGKDTKFFLMAEEFNDVVGAVNALDNVRKEILISCPGTITPLAFAVLINELPSFEIGHNDLITFKAVSADAEPITYYVELLNLGKGSYGIDGTVLTAENIKITSFGANSNDIAELSTTQIIDLGYQGSPVSESLNIQLPNIEIQDQSEGYVIVKGIFAGGEFHEYLWLGVAGTYGGAGGSQSTDADFKELSATTDVASKEDKSNKTGTVVGNEASTSLYLHIAGMIAYFQKKDEQIEIGANINVQNSWHGQTILFTANCTITVPATLNNQLMFPFRTLTGVTVTWAITSPFKWETTPTATPEKKVGHFMRRGSTNTIFLDV